jgi:hypothetical protein
MRADLRRSLACLRHRLAERLEGCSGTRSGGVQVQPEGRLARPATYPSQRAPFGVATTSCRPFVVSDEAKRLDHEER